MNVEINLLREKSKSSPIYRLVLFMLVTFVLVVTTFFYYKYGTISAEISKLEDRIKVVEDERLVIQTQLSDKKVGSYVDEYNQDVSAIENIHFSSVSILNDFVKLLPERGFFIDYAFTDDGTVYIYVKFDTLTEMSVYTDGLSTLPYVTGVNLDDVDILEVANEDNEVLPKYYIQYTIFIDIDTVKAVQGDGEGEAS